MKDHKKEDFRQFKQYGVELFCENNPYYEAEIILLANQILKSLKLKKYKILINSIGGKQTRAKYIEAIKQNLLPDKNKLSSFSQENLIKNPLRILDSKDERDLKVVKKIPPIYDFLSSTEKKYFDQVKEILDKEKISYEVDYKLVRGLDYYNNFVFEIIDLNNNSRTNTIIGGGRYDNVFSHNNLSAVGFAMGIDRLVEKATEEGYILNEKIEPLIYIASLGQEAFQNIAFSLHHLFLQQNISNYLDYNWNKKIKYHLNKYTKLEADFLIIIGEKELQQKVIKIKSKAKKVEKEFNFLDINGIKKFINQN